MKTIDLTEFTSPTHDYHLHFWGGIENGTLNKTVFGTEKTDFWFPDTETRQKVKLEMKRIADEQGKVIVFDEHDGELGRYRTICKMIFVYEGKEYPYEYDFGYGYPEDSARFMFEDGNYSCDCNRALFIRETNPDFPELDCGEEITMKDFEVAD